MNNETSPNPYNQMATFILKGFGVTAAIAAYVFELIKGNIPLIVPLFLVYEVVVIIFGRVTSVGGCSKGTLGPKISGLY